MNEPKLPTFKDVNRIVINRIAVWELNDDMELWHKTEGGPGFKHLEPCKARIPHSMERYIRSILYRRYRENIFKNHDLVLMEEKYLYRWWKSNRTLNVVTRIGEWGI